MMPASGFNENATRSQPCGHERRRVGDRRQEQQHLQRERQHVLHVAVLHVERRGPQSDREREEQRQEDHDRQEARCRPWAPRRTTPSSRPAARPDHRKVHERSRDRRDRDDQPREIDLGQQVARCRPGCSTIPRPPTRTTATAECRSARAPDTARLPTASPASRPKMTVKMTTVTSGCSSAQATPSTVCL